MLEQKYQYKIDPATKRAMRKYIKTMTLLHQADVARDYKRNGQPLKYITYIALKPELVGRLGRVDEFDQASAGGETDD
jgi:hypothetical protein